LTAGLWHSAIVDIVRVTTRSRHRDASHMASALVFWDLRSRYIPVVWAHLSPESVTLRTSHWAGGDVKGLSLDDKRLLSLRGSGYVSLR